MFYILEEMHQFCLCSEPEHVLSELNLRIWLRALATCTHAVNQKASCSHPRVSTNFVDYCLSYGLCYFLLILIGSSSGRRCHLAALLGQKKIKQADVCWLYACHVDHSSFRRRPLVRHFFYLEVPCKALFFYLEAPCKAFFLTWRLLVRLFFLSGGPL